MTSEARNEATLVRMVRILRSVRFGMTAGRLGHELWGTHRTGRPENVCMTAWARPAGKLLKRAKASGLVYDCWNHDSKRHVWYANIPISVKEPT